jgi:hypothetical protein
MQMKSPMVSVWFVLAIFSHTILSEITTDLPFDVFP